MTTGTISADLAPLSAAISGNQPAPIFSTDFSDFPDGSLPAKMSVYNAAGHPNTPAIVSGQARMLLDTNPGDVTLWFNGDRGRGDGFPKVAVPATGTISLYFLNVGIGTVADPNADVPHPGGSAFVFSGPLAFLNNANWMFYLPGFRNGQRTGEAKITRDNSSSVVDEGELGTTHQNVRFDIQSTGLIRIYRQAAGDDPYVDPWVEVTLPTGEANIDWRAVADGGDGDGFVEILWVTYAQGTNGLPVVGTMDEARSSADDVDPVTVLLQFVGV